MKFFEAFQTLFSRSRAFQLYVDNNKRRLIKGLSFLPENIRHEAELVYMDTFPDTTRYPEKWEDVFGVLFTEDELEKRRDIIDSLWKINKGGQGVDFLEDILQKIDTTIQVIENNPVINPRMVRVVNIAVCGNRGMVCGGRNAICGSRLGKDEFVPTVLRNDSSEFYDLPFDPAYWQTCFFICKSVVRVKNTIVYIQPLSLSAVWKNYLEYLILRIKPVHTTAIVFINWIEEE